MIPRLWQPCLLRRYPISSARPPPHHRILNPCTAHRSHVVISAMIVGRFDKTANRMYRAYRNHRTIGLVRYSAFASLASRPFGDCIDPAASIAPAVRIFAIATILPALDYWFAHNRRPSPNRSPVAYFSGYRFIRACYLRLISLSRMHWSDRSPVAWTTEVPCPRQLVSGRFACRSFPAALSDWLKHGLGGIRVLLDA